VRPSLIVSTGFSVPLLLEPTIPQFPRTYLKVSTSTTQSMLTERKLVGSGTCDCHVPVIHAACLASPVRPQVPPVTRFVGPFLIVLMELFVNLASFHGTFVLDIADMVRSCSALSRYPDPAVSTRGSEIPTRPGAMFESSPPSR
jgi:hypothetical protein